MVRLEKMSGPVPRVNDGTSVEEQWTKVTNDCPRAL